MPKFVKGSSGNPAGRRRGIADRRVQARELFATRRDDLIAKAIDLALEGDVAALRRCLDRVAPLLKATATLIMLPIMPTGLREQGQFVLRHLASGHISPDDALTVISAIAQLTRIHEAAELERRIEALERGMEDVQQDTQETS